MSRSKQEIKAEKQVTTILTEKNLINIDNAATSAEAIKASTKTSLTSALKSYRLMQADIVNVMRHVEKHGNINVLNDYYAAVKAARVNEGKMGEFILKFAPVTYNVKTKGFVRIEGSFNIKGAMEKPWWKVGAAVEPKAYSDEQLFAIAVGRMTKKRASTKEDPKAVFNEVLYQKAFNLAKEYDLLSEDDSLDTEDQDDTQPEVHSEAQAA